MATFKNTMKTVITEDAKKHSMPTEKVEAMRKVLFGSKASEKPQQKG